MNRAVFDALNVVYGEKEKRSLLRFYLTTFLFTLGMIGLVIAAIGAVVVAPLVLTFIGFVTRPNSSGHPALGPPFAITFASGSPLFTATGPVGKTRNGAVTAGSVTAAMLWLGASMLFSWYVANFDSYNKTYGSLGAGVGFRRWIWLSV